MGETDQQMHNKLNRVEAAVDRLEVGVGHVNVQVAQVGQRAEEVNGRLQQLTQAFESYVLQAERTANVQRSEVRIGVVEAQLEHQFGHYKVVRRVATGMLQGFDLGLVSDDTMRDVGEQLMMETPRYWLTPVLLALRHWLADEPEPCERAVQEAFRRSPSKTSLFMALVLRRQDRGEGSLRWLRHFLAALDPNELGREFAMILESVAQGGFGPGGVQLVKDRLDQWRAQLLVDDAKQQAQVDRWRAEMDRYVASPAADRFPRLAEVSPQWPQMDGALSRAGAHAALIATYSAMAAEELTSPDRLEDQIDDILDLLVTGFDDEELPLRREHAEHRAVVATGGDLATAQHALDTDLLALEQKLDYLTIESESALNPARLGVSRATQRMAVAACHDWFARAHAAYSRDYRAALPANVEAVFEQDHNAGGVVFHLPRWVGSFTQPMEVLEQSLEAHWDKHAQPFIDSFTYRWGRNLMLPAAILLPALVCFGYTQPVGIVFVLIAAAVWGMVLWGRFQKAEQAQQQARDLLTLAKHDSVQQLRGAGAELVDWTTAFQSADQQEQQVRTLIAGLATAGNGATPYERRVAQGA